jgi:hypothetical protein
VDYLPGTIATIVSYCSAEVSRGFWKYASMNGQDWPSPAANLLTIQGEVKDILAATGVHVPNPTGSFFSIPNSYWIKVVCICCSIHLWFFVVGGASCRFRVSVPN